MASLAARYKSGNHAAVWRELDQHWLSVSEQFNLFSASPAPSADEIEDVMRQTFERVAHNTDLVIGRLRDTGYRFECESGRHTDAKPPRTPCQKNHIIAQAAIEGRFGDMPVFQDNIGPFPMALTCFADIVGNVDLRQRYPVDKNMSFEDIIAQLPNDPPIDLTDDMAKQMEFLAEILEKPLPDDPAEKTRLLVIQQEDAIAHPQADDPVVSRLGDWDPFEFDMDYLLYEISEEEAEMLPKEDGGLALIAEFAASFEHKANVSGASNPAFHFPSNRYDPIVHAEGIKLPFTTYLRRIFSRGGFYGIPRKIRENQVLDHEVEQGIFLPNHPIFKSLAQDLIAF